MIDRATISRIMDAADIVDVVKEFVTLRKAGVNYKGLCPFHDEKTPSFVVSPSKQLCKCFSCGKGGNVVHFVMEHEQMTYPEAIKWLGRKYGIEVREKEETDEERQAASERESMFVLNEWARDYFCDILRNHADGRAVGMAYFRKRGFRDDIIRKFQLGFSLSSRAALSEAALAKGYKADYLLKTGLAYRTEDGRLLDRYHGRVIFPVHTVSGKVVAFGGRVLQTGEKVAKYVNSPESEIYHKSSELYGLYFAKHAIVKQNRCFLVEGYTDVISMHQSGVENVVASSGTSLTEGQIRLLHRFTNNITVLYDGDSAGIKASLRGIDMLLAEGMNIKVLLLPDGDDPDSFARKHDAAAFQQYIDAHQTDFIKFKTGLLLADCGDDPVKRAGLIADIVESIAVIPDAIIRQMYVHECAADMGVDEKLIVSEVAKKRRQQRAAAGKEGVPASGPGGNGAEETPQASPPVVPASVDSEREKLLISLVVKYGELPLFAEDEGEGGEGIMRVAPYIREELANDGITLSDDLNARVLEEAAGKADVPGFKALPYFLSHPDPQVSLLAADIAEEKYQLSRYHSKDATLKGDRERLPELVPRIVSDYKYAIVKAEMKRLLKELASPEVKDDPSRCLAVMEEYKKMSEVERLFAQILGDRVLTI